MTRNYKNKNKYVITVWGGLSMNLKSKMFIQTV